MATIRSQELRLHHDLHARGSHSPPIATPSPSLKLINNPIRAHSPATCRLYRDILWSHRTSCKFPGSTT